MTSSPASPARITPSWIQHPAEHAREQRSEPGVSLHQLADHRMAIAGVHALLS